MRLRDNSRSSVCVRARKRTRSQRASRANARQAARAPSSPARPPAARELGFVLYLCTSSSDSARPSPFERQVREMSFGGRRRRRRRERETSRAARTQNVCLARKRKLEKQLWRGERGERFCVCQWSRACSLRPSAAACCSRACQLRRRRRLGLSSSACQTAIGRRRHTTRAVAGHAIALLTLPLASVELVCARTVSERTNGFARAPEHLASRWESRAQHLRGILTRWATGSQQSRRAPPPRRLLATLPGASDTILVHDLRERQAEYTRTLPERVRQPTKLTAGEGKQLTV